MKIETETALRLVNGIRLERDAGLKEIEKLRRKNRIVIGIMVGVLIGTMAFAVFG